MFTRAALAALTLLTLAACGEAGAPAASQDKYAGLDVAIRDWREALLKERADCAGAPADKACRAFEVACKGERAPSGGASADVAAAMTFESWDAARSEFRPASAFAEFVKDGDGWRRAEIGPLNLSTCVGA